ncbi:hypothetical protein Emed_001474 [Eimeria media]
MGLFFRNREEDLADPDLRASRYFLFKNKQSEENKLKNAEKKYGYTLGELHAYKHFMTPPRLPERMQQEKPEIQRVYEHIERLTATEVYVPQTENHFVTKTEESATGIKSSSAESRKSDQTRASCEKPQSQDEAVDESCVKCLGFYVALDRCVREVSKADEKNRYYKHTRLHACKPHWVWFKRCTGYRDKQLLKEIFSWEEKHVQGLNPAERRAYTEQLLGAKRYLEYSSARSRDAVEVVRMEREASHLNARIEKLRASVGIS